MSVTKRILCFIFVILFAFGNTAIAPVSATGANNEGVQSFSASKSEAAGSVAAAVTLPTAATLVGTTHLPPIANQGAVGCCASMAATYLQFTNAYSRYIHSIDESSSFNPSSGKAMYNFSPRFTYNLAGSGTAWVYEVLKEQGTVLQTYSTFSGGVTGFASDNALANDWATIDGYWTEAMRYRISDYDQVWMSKYNFQLTTTADGRALLERIKTAIHNGNVVVTGGYPDRWDYTTVKQGGSLGKVGEQVIYRSTNRSSGGHQVSIVGYDDNLTCTVNGVTLKGAFLVANSWGNTWKNKGYTWVMYDAINQSSEYTALNHTNRQWTLDQFVFLDWQTDLCLEMPALSAKIEIETADRNGFSVVMTRTDAKGNTQRYTPYIVQNENLMPKYNEGLNFYGKTGNATGYLNYSFGPLLDLPAGSDYDDYVWGVTVSTDAQKTATVKKIQLLDQNGSVLYTEDDTVSLLSAQSNEFLFSDLCIVSTDLPKGAILETVSGNSLCPKGQTYSFKIKAANGYKTNNLTVMANDSAIYAVDGVYTVTVNDNMKIRVSGIIPITNDFTTGWYGTGFENWSNKFLMLVTIDNKWLDPTIYAKESELNSGNYPYYFRVTVNSQQVYYFTPHSFYYFDTSTLYRLPVVDQGWIPQNGTSYRLTIEICNENDILYSCQKNVKCQVSIEQSYSTHTHSYNTNNRILNHPANCAQGGSYDAFCQVNGCHAAKSYTTSKNSTLHTERYSVTVEPTLYTEGSYTEYCSHCHTEVNSKVLEKIFPKEYDLDKSGAVNIADVNTMLVYLAEHSELPSEEDCAIYDLDHDKCISVADLNILLVFLATT